jgi:hypothetical protein
MTAPTIDDLAELKNELIRKALRGFIAVADLSVPAPTAITDSDSNPLPLAAGWDRLGNISKKTGIGFSRDTTASDIESWGQNDPTRTDITKDVNGAKFECQETRRATLEMYYNLDLSTIVPDPASGEVSFAQPTSLRTIYRRIFFLASDGYGEDEIFIGKLMPRFMISKVDDQNWNDDDAMAYGITGNAKVDSALGFSVKHFFGGPGWKNLLSEMGFAGSVHKTVTINGGPTGGTFTLTVNGQTTSGIAFNATASAVQSALAALSTVGSGNVAVTGSGPYDVTLSNGGTLTADGSGLTGGTSPSVTVA